MDYQRFIEFHVQRTADMTIGVLPVPREEAARQFGVLEVNADHRVVGFQEKPDDPKPIPGDPRNCLASMGIYVSSMRFLFEALCHDATRSDSRHDFGGDVIPAIMERHRVIAYPFLDETRQQAAYWRDVGTLDAYYAANMDLVSVAPQLNLYDEAWPIRTHRPNCPPPKFVFADEPRRGFAVDSIVCPGSIISGGRVQRSLIGRQCRINSFACVEDSILFNRVTVGRHARLRRARGSLTGWRFLVALCQALRQHPEHVLWEPHGVSRVGSRCRCGYSVQGGPARRQRARICPG